MDVVNCHASAHAAQLGADVTMMTSSAWLLAPVIRQRPQWLVLNDALESLDLDSRRLIETRFTVRLHLVADRPGPTPVEEAVAAHQLSAFLSGHSGG